MAYSAVVHRRPSPHPGSSIPRKQRPPPLRRGCKYICNAAVVSPDFLPDYLDAVVRYACPEISRALLLTDPSPPIHPGACLELVMHPGVEEQARIVMAMHLLAMQTDIENLQGTFLRLLLVGDVDAVKALIAHAVEYNRSLDAIREIVEGAKALGFHTGGVSETI